MFMLYVFLSASLYQLFSIRYNVITKVLVTAGLLVIKRGYLFELGVIFHFQSLQVNVTA